MFDSEHLWYWYVFQDVGCFDHEKIIIEYQYGITSV
jgi:hypothetical protein